jgi:asparagine synthase (glutamine-hydrolysing)
LDSRIVAGIVRSLELDDEIDSVSTFTWGVNNSRDVHYARRIAKDFGWEFNHFVLNSDTLKRNIRRAGELGAEFSPLHLHALPEVREHADVDLILGGSYGNSIGRAEYSGRHVLELDNIVPYWLNKFGVLKQNVVSTNRKAVYGDAYKYQNRIERSDPVQYREIEQQLHYMRRLLQPCMTHVAEQVPLYQLFTAPRVVELMWGLDPKIRGKTHCVEVLKRLPGGLESIPNAKSGIPPNGDEPVSDDLDSEHHKYGHWLREDLREDVRDLIENSPLNEIFNEQAVKRLLHVWPRASTRSTNAIDELVSWLASLSVFIQEYNISVRSTTNNFVDTANGIVGPISAQGYQAVRGIFRE